MIVNSDCQSSDGGCWAESSIVWLGQQLLVIVAGNPCTPHELRQNWNTKSKAQELGAQESLDQKLKQHVNWLQQCMCIYI